jgi:hypothetical protein
MREEWEFLIYMLVVLVMFVAGVGVIFGLLP